MRFEGTLKTWDEQRGFGYIAMHQDGQEVFVQFSAFPRDGHVPALGDTLTFEVQTSPEGKRRAMHVRRPGQVPARVVYSRRPRKKLLARVKPVFNRAWLVLGLLAALGGWYAYEQFSQPAPAQPVIRHAL